MLTTTNPATGEAIQSYEQFSDQQVDETIRACHAAFLKWKTLSYAERGEHLQNLAQTLRDHKDELMETMTREMGKLHRQGRQEIELCAGICEYTAQSAPELLQDEERELPNGGNGLVTYSPIGVVYGIQPWNFPAYQVIRYAVASLMAGNGVLLKHAENVTGSALLLEKLFQKAGGAALAVEADVTKRGDIKNLVQKTNETFGPCDVLVNNAGIMPLSYMKNMHVEEWLKMVDVNVNGVLHCLAETLPDMVERKKGHIVNISSVAGREVMPGGAVYSGNKFAVRAISDGLRQELAPSHNIRVTCIEPGAVDTELTNTITDKELVEDFKDAMGDLDFLNSDAIAQAIHYAVSQPDDVHVNELQMRPTSQG
jgi:NADP-dependent 3-hydroxy acid dehydrogenase YdfG